MHKCWPFWGGRFLQGELYPAATVGGAQGPHPAGAGYGFLPVVLLGGPPGHPCRSLPPPSPVWHRVLPAPRLCSGLPTATPISTACCPWMTGLSGRATCPCAPPWGRRRPVSPSNDAWAAGPSPFCPWRRSPPSAFPCPWAPLEVGGVPPPLSLRRHFLLRGRSALRPGARPAFCQPVRPGRLPLPDFEEGSL